jgi:type IV pilus assembly protein PilV
MSARMAVRRSRRPRGFGLIEVLVTLLVTAFGLLGIAGFVTRVSATGVESNQRARALALMEDMAERLRNNRAQAASYVAAGVARGAAAQDCSALAGAPRDLCEWNNLLFGTNDAQTDGAAQALRFRGCVTQPFLGQPVYVVSVAWASLSPATPPADPCAEGAFGADTHRRVVRTQVRVANLSA